MNRYATWILVSLMLFSAGSLTARATEVVDINHATAEQLADAIDGVGLKKAQRIIENRDQLGPFRSVQDLTRVKGIGSKLVENSRARLRAE